jgi:hypothetical protein
LLANTVRDQDGTTLRTLDDVRRYILALPESRQHRQSWLSATEPILQSGSGGDVAAATRQIEFALLMGGKLDMRK